MNDLPDAAANQTVTITIGIDGRLYFYEMLPELLAIAESICPTDPQLLARKEALHRLITHEHNRA